MSSAERTVMTVMGCPSWTAGNSVTSCSSLNASGFLLPSLTVFKRQEEKNRLCKKFYIKFSENNTS